MQTHQSIGPLLRLPSVLTRTGLSRAELYRRITAGKFPQPIKLGARAVAWPSAQIDNWIKAVSGDGAQ